MEREHNDRMSLAWHIAALPRTKRFPKLEKLLVKQTATRKRQTWQQQLAIMDMWVAATKRRSDQAPRIN